jgi:hypothetical protein
VAAYTHNTGGTIYFDALTGGSAVAAVDTHVISANTTLQIRTDTYACANHSAAVGSLDTVSFSGQGGKVRIDPTYVRVVAYTGGSGNSPAYGAAISQGGVSGVFLGAWTNWLSEPIAAGAAIGATGYIKIGGTTGGEWAAGALTGITATCSGASVQGWIEVRGPDTSTITMQQIGTFETVEAWFELGTTNGARGQVLACPTAATNAGVIGGVWIETAAGSGVYEPYSGVGSTVAVAAWRTTDDMKVIWQTTAGIRIGSDGTNNVGYLPPTGCKVRIPAIFLTNCTRSAGSGSGPRVLPNATIATRQEFITTNAGTVDLRGCVCQWYMNMTQAFRVKYKGVVLSDAMILSEIATALDVDNCIVSPTQAQANTALQITSCFAGGTIQNSRFERFSLAASGNYIATINYATNVTFSGNYFRSFLLRGNATTGAISSTQAKGCTFTNNTLIGGKGLFVGAQNCTFTNTGYLDHTLTTTTSATNPMSTLEFTTGSSGNVIDGTPLPIAANGPYTALVTITASYNTLVKNIGTSYTAPLAMNASVTGLGINATGNNDGITAKRVYLSNTRTGPYAFVNSDTNILLENIAGDTADTTVMAGLNAIAKNVMITSATTGQTSVYGTHWITRFTSTTAGFTEILCNEPTATSATQCAATSGAPQWSSTGNLLLTKVGDQVTWEMPFFAVGYTAFTNSAPTITGTNVTYSSGARWGNHDIEFQVDTGSGYGGTWLALTAANLIAQTFNSTTGFKLKIRATCATAAAGNILTNLRVAMTTTQTDRDTKLYPLSVNTVTLTGLVPGSDVTILAAGTETVLQNTEDIGGTTATYTYSGAQTVDISIFKESYMPYTTIRNLALTTTDSSLPIVQSPDPSYLE